MVINNTQIQSKLMNNPPWLDLWSRCYSANFQPGASLTTFVIVRWGVRASSSPVDMFVEDFFIK